MSTQPEALLCAEMLEVARDNPTWADYSEIPKEACRRSAAELRRQHAECNDLARQLNESNERNGRLKAERDALLEAVAWECKAGGLKALTQRQYDAQTAATKRHYTRIAPPQRPRLTDEEIVSCLKVELARAIERKVRGE